MSVDAVGAEVEDEAREVNNCIRWVKEFRLQNQIPPEELLCGDFAGLSERGSRERPRI